MRSLFEGYLEARYLGVIMALRCSIEKQMIRIPITRRTESCDCTKDCVIQLHAGSLVALFSFLVQVTLSQSLRFVLEIRHGA